MSDMVTAYDLGTESCRPVPNLNHARWDHINCIVGNFLCVTGGRSGDFGYPILNSIEMLDLRDLKTSWSSGQHDCQWNLVSDPIFTNTFYARVCCQVNDTELLVLGFKIDSPSREQAAWKFDTNRDGSFKKDVPYPEDKYISR